MVFKKRLDGGSYGFNVPNIPRAPRSCRRKAFCKRTDGDSQICAFDLLASLAGKLLQESESSSASTSAFEGNGHSDLGKEVQQEQLDEFKQLKTEFTDQGTSDSTSSENTSQKCLLVEFPFFEDDGLLEQTSVAGCLEKEEGCVLPSKLDGSLFRESCDSVVNKQQRVESHGLGNGGLTAANTCKSKVTTELHMEFAELINTVGDVKLPSSRDDPVPNASCTRQNHHTKLGVRDDDENLFRYYKFSNKFKSFRPPTRNGSWSIRKQLSSKYWKAGPKLKDFEFARDRGLKPLHSKRKTCYNYNSYEVNTVYKRRKLSDRSSIVTSDGGFSSDSVSNSPENDDTANGVLSSVTGLQPKDSQVKFSIKSFKIPELFVEVPETNTVGSLKRTVLEAVTALLGGGIRVGVLVQGKRVRDDNKTLSETGISCKENLDYLGFSLEHVLENTSPRIRSEDPLLSPSDGENFSRSSMASPTLDSRIPGSYPDSIGLTNSDNHVDQNRELVPYLTKTPTEEYLSESRALVPVPEMNVAALAIVPVNQKPKQSESAQRRTRRPFSVSEVEALVHAVEDIGTGRWRDVKLRAFENADHRTYVDLKDKWKTLVHTASISPQQRRGEPVPQELLDRVLAALAYWSQQQAKQHCKNQSSGAPKIVDIPAAATSI